MAVGCGGRCERFAAVECVRPGRRVVHLLRQGAAARGSPSGPRAGHFGVGWSARLGIALLLRGMPRREGASYRGGIPRVPPDAAGAGDAGGPQPPLGHAGIVGRAQFRPHQRKVTGRPSGPLATGAAPLRVRIPCCARASAYTHRSAAWRRQPGRLRRLGAARTEAPPHPPPAREDSPCVARRHSIAVLKPIRHEPGRRSHQLGRPTGAPEPGAPAPDTQPPLVTAGAAPAGAPGAPALDDVLLVTGSHAFGSAVISPATIPSIK